MATDALQVESVAARAALPAALKSVNYNVITSSKVHLRKSNTNASASMGLIPRGTSVKATAVAVNGWYKVSYKGKRGYISNPYAKQAATSKGSSFETSAVLGKRNKLSADYKPRLGKLPNSKQKLRTDAATAFNELNAEAKGKGIRLKVVSGYRSYDSQKAELAKYTKLYGAQYARKVVALPGLSEHQTGLSVDLGASNGQCRERTCFAKTREGRWLAVNAPRYGFILRYPKGSEKVTGFNFEPWHYRYVGTSVAKTMKIKKIATLEQFNKMN
ncbi:D-alanyl-D-alanine carboxypeptidase family protein [Paeniglutamicibacter kerguelensis]|uniref:LAS superfamily LD-carboxypeptidase LdcB n=1 Tax=Paeniglutamicibacter kerguelensis TaxID=254788 RepID=A0ABS4XHS5_9MICC|nr:D-alanyl-D-alanine carboxypeptidase family protein [Paeniglutamicibacter kerguelensis]MBP2387985.1 LAS superfamily LD-carboxypeptidase LdcB [Paeniglutamicibacter kerguelensis]